MVVPVEDTNVPAGAVTLPDKVVITTAHHDRTHIRHRGENCQVGDVIAHAGTVIDAGGDRFPAVHRGDLGGSL